MSAALAGTLFCTSGAANAGIVNVTFVDQGTSTIDTTSGLEWLDVTLTTGRSVDDVFADLQDGTLTLSSSGAPTDGWRFATPEEVFGLFTNWFGPFTPAPHPDWYFDEYVAVGNAVIDEDLVELYITTFGDNFYNGQGLPGQLPRLGLGYTRGVYVFETFHRIDGITVPQTVYYNYSVEDMDWYRRSEGVYVPADQDDRVLSNQWEVLPYAVSNSVGMALVRTAPTEQGTPVPTPSGFGLFSFGLLGLAVLRRRRRVAA